MTLRAALAGLKVVDFSNVPTGVQVSQLFADFGAEVIHVEPSGGSPLRAEAAWPFWARGKRSIQLDLHDPADLVVAKHLAGGADVVIETFRPGVAERLGLGYKEMSHSNPGLVYGSISGFGRKGPLASLQGYEGIVMAKFGACWALTDMAGEPGRPAFASALYASYASSQLLAQAILAALYEREDSGVGQRVETTLAQGLTVHDVYSWFSRVVAQRYSDGFKQALRVTDGVPSGSLSFRLLIALTKDGRWLQFSQVPDRQFRALMKMFGLSWMYDDPKWSNLPDFDTHQQRKEYWEMLLEIVRSKTVAEWAVEFDRDSNVWAELFRKDSELLDHPQMDYNEMVAQIDDPERGSVRQPGALVRMDSTPAQLDRSAPRLGEHDAAIRAAAGASTPAARSMVTAEAGKPPLAGVTVIELGSYYAAPYGATLLAELGARVIKLEPLEGDSLRYMLPFPEIAALKVLQGKESVAVDLGSAKGRAIAYRMLKEADIVLQSFRAGVAERLGLDAESLRALNPDIVYLGAPGYGEGGPCGHRPAFAPTIGAAAGLAWRNAESAAPEGDSLSLDEIKRTAIKLGAAVMGVGNADGLSSVSVGTAMMLGLLARRRGAGGQKMLTSMLSSMAHALSEVMVEYEGRPDPAKADPGLHGFSALYRLYQAADGWLFLASPSEKEWRRLTGALPEGATLGADPRFATAADRKANNDALAAALAAIFLVSPGQHWEDILRAADVACVVCAPGPVESNYLDDGSPGERCGFNASGHHPILDDVPRLAPLVAFSRSSTVAGNAGLVGQDTKKVLRDFGYDEPEITGLAQEGVIGVG
jgi:crotonobetainyl-CoA:carnitine CoA-transferase CaiB-like acyl-CoA transferase